MKNNVRAETTGPGKQWMTEDRGKREVKGNFKKMRLGEWKNSSAMKRIREIKRKSDLWPLGTMMNSTLAILNLKDG